MEKAEKRAMVEDKDRDFRTLLTRKYPDVFIDAAGSSVGDLVWLHSEPPPSEVARW